MQELISILKKAATAHLSLPAYHFVDNSLAYYLNPKPQHMQEDKEFFRQPLPPVEMILQYCSDEFVTQAQARSFLYSHVEDQHSRDILILTALYAILGHRFVKFPCYTPHTISYRQSLQQQYRIPETDSEFSQALREDRFGVGASLSTYRFPCMDTTLTVTTTAQFLYDVFAFPPYQYQQQQGQPLVAVNEGDVVLDCGACLGDTALFFAARTGSTGRIISFEPHPGLQQLYMHNRLANPQLAERMALISRPVGSDSQTEITLNLCGPGTHQGSYNPRLNCISVKTIALDDLWQAQQWSRIDFIKMDIEGAELSALHGARQLICHFRPKLAICLYHKLSDFDTIPRFIHSLNLGYRFYVEHHFMNNWETVLYALPQ